MARVGKRSVRKALQEHGGVVAKVAAAFGVSRQTVYTWIAKYDLRGELTTARNLMFDLAADNIYLAVQAGNLDISKFVLTHMPPPAGQERWSNRTELTGADGAPLGLSPDVLEMLRRMGVEPSEVVREFEQMIRQQADVGNGVQDG